MSIKNFFIKRLRYLDNKQYLESLVLSIIALIGSLVVNYYASTYANNHSSTVVGDVFLSNINVLPVASIFIYSSAIFVIFVIIVYITHPQRIPFTFKSAAFFIFIRALFINLTWIGQYPDAVTVPNSKWFTFFSFKNDLFFSGHTGFPLLMAFIFWDLKPLRYIFIGCSVFFATIVLMGHLHYSIDVASAFFITYTIFHLSQIILKQDFKMAREGIKH